MTALSDKNTILGIDPCHDGVAFVFFEDGAPVDWGTRRRDGRELDVLDALIADYGPELVVMEDPRAAGCERRARMRQILRRFSRHCESLQLPVVAVARRVVRDGWRTRGVTRKQAAAVEIAREFPDLATYLPRPRKHSREVPRERLFGIADLVLHALRTERRAENRTS